MKIPNLLFTIRKSSQSGFTLIEVLIYVLFLTLFLGGSIGIAYNILKNSQDNRTKIAIEEEGNFLLKKISWVVNDTDTITVPSSDTLLVNKFETLSDNPVVVNLSGGVVNIKRGSNPAKPLNDSLFVVSNLNFELINTGPISTDILKASFYINGKKFSLTRYVR